MARRKFTREFKESAAGLVNGQGYTIPEAARSLGVDPACIRAWVRELSPEAGTGTGTGTGASGDGAVLRAENQRLRKENARLLMEREILKKAAAFFAKDQP